MKLVAFVIIVPLILLAALTAVAYITDRLHIGQNVGSLFPANISQSLPPLYSNHEFLYEEFTEFLRQVLEENYKGLGIRCPKNKSSIMPPFRSHGIQLSQNLQIFNYEVQQEEILYGGGCKRVIRNTMTDAEKGNVIANALLYKLPHEYGFEKIQVISTPEVVIIKILGAIYNPLCYNAKNIHL